MPLISNFPEVFNDEHHAWHTPGAHPQFPTRAIPLGQPGSGIEFLQFHRTFMAKVLNWYSQQPLADLNAVAPWTAIPNVLKQTQFWNAQEAADEQRIITLNPSFPSQDAFGIFVETGIHNRFLHSATAAAFNEPIVGTFHSPQSTFFYNIHGLVDHWWRPLQGFGNLADGRPFWIGNFAPQANQAQALFYFPGDQNWWLGVHDGNRLNWSLVGNTVGFGQVWDGRPFWIGNFAPQANRTQVLFYFPGDQNWWLGVHDGNQLNWSLAGNTAGFGQVWDGRPFWIGNFSPANRSEVLFYFPGDQNWWLGTHDGNQLNWSLAGNTAGFGQVADGRPFWTGNFSPQANRTQVLFYFPGDQNWWLGTHDGNQLNWSLAGNTAGFHKSPCTSVVTLSSKAATTGISFDLSGKERWPNKKPPNKPVELTAHSVRFSPYPTLSPVGRSSPVAFGSRIHTR